MLRQTQEFSKRQFGVFTTAAVGGILFLLPLVVVCVLLSYIYSAVIVIYNLLRPYIPVSSVVGYITLFLMALGILVMLCFFCGLLARRALARKLSKGFENQLTMVFPKYPIYKDLLADSIGGSENVPSLTPVLVEMADCKRLAFEADRLPDGSVVVYLPGGPDTWVGDVVLVKPEQVKPTELEFSDVLRIMERLGRDSYQVYQERKATQ
ncbi:MAG: hypothetical protein ACE37I_02445 [Rubinisphaera brasiliensis]|uniref:hypothetical protein n=1 Tax=Rubinisphaera brasiliensis TaxID=119 RepID=UPI00391A62F3